MAAKAYRVQAAGRLVQRRRLLQVAALGGAGAAGLALVGCGGSNNGNKNTGAGRTATVSATVAAPPSVSSTAATPGRTTAAGTPAASQAAATRAAAAPTPAAAQPRRGGTFKTASPQGQDIPHFDFHLDASALLSGTGPGIAYSRLLYFDIGPQGVPAGNYAPQGDLAEKWEQVDDLTYLFHLRPGVKWQNIAPVNGRDLVADDVVYSFNRQIQLKAAASFLGPLQSTTAPDKATVRITLAEPNIDQVLNLAGNTQKILTHEAVEVHGDIKEGPSIGTGPWIFLEKEWVKGSVQPFARNPNYYSQAQPYADRYETLVIPDASTRFAAFRTRQILALSPVNKDQLDQLKGQDLSVVKRRVGRGTSLAAHTQHAPTNDPRVRQALSKLLDRQQIIDTIQLGDGWWSAGLNNISTDLLLPEDEVKKLLARDVAGAKQLLQAAGVSNWAPKMQVLNVNSSLGELVQAQLKDGGVNASIEIIDPVRLQSQVNTGNFDNLYLGEILSGPNPTADLQGRFGTKGQSNGPQLSDPQLDQLISQQARERDRAKRTDLLKQIQRAIIDLASEIPTTSTIEVGAVWNSLKDFNPTLLGGLYEYWKYQVAWLSG